MYYDHPCKRCGKPLNMWRPSRVKPPKIHQECMAHRARDLTPEREEMLREAYAQAKTLPQLSRELDRLMQHPLFFEYPRYVLHGWASGLGLSHIKRGGPWNNPKENEILENYANACTLWQIYRKFQKAGFQRSITAIATRIHKNGWHYRGDFYSIKQVCEAMGCGYETASRWIKEKLLKPHHSNGQGTFVSPLELARFIRQHSEEAGQGRPYLPFVVALLGEFK